MMVANGVGLTKEEVDTLDVAVVNWEDAITLEMAELVATVGDMVGLDTVELLVAVKMHG